ncbi:uncharacterized protein ACO6RY_02688 [Pungitius sinensis]
METEIGEIPNAAAFIPSPQSEAVANELQELSLQPASNTLQVRERKDVLQLKLQQRRSREELVNQGIMPPLKSSAAFHEQRRSLERARTEDYLKRKIRARPKRSELIRMHILEETSAEPSLQAKQLQLKRARIADDLNDKISHRPGPMELIHKNILPVHSSMKRVIIETRFPKASGDTSSCDEDSNYSLSPEGPGYLDSPLGLLPLPSPPETPACSSTPSPTQVSPPALPLAPISFKLSGGTAASSAQRTSQIKPKTSSDRSAQRLKKPKDNKPKIKKLKYHQYIPPDQKGDIEPPPHLDSSYAKILHQQQLFLQLQILSQQQQQHYNYHTILPAPPKAQTDQLPSSSSSFNSTTPSSPPRPVAASSKVPSNHGGHICQSSAALRGTKPVSLPPNLEEMKVAELKSELKLRSLPVSGTKNDLIERLRTYQELIGGSDSTSSPAAGGTTEPGAEGAGRSSRNAAETTNNTPQPQQQFQCLQTSSQTGGSAATPRQLTMTCGGTTSPPTASITHPECSPGATSPENTSFNGDPLEEMMSSQLSRASLQPRSAARLTASIKEESNGADQAPCQFSSKQASREHHCLVSSTAVTMTTTAPVGPVDKDRMLQEKDKRIEELTRMLRQKQRLVEVLRMQLDHGKRGGPEPLVLVRVKHEPPDTPGVPQSFGPQPISTPPSSASCEMDAIKVAVKQEAIEAEEDARETATQLPAIHGLPRPLTLTPEGLERAQLQIQPEQTSAQTKQQHVRLQQTSLQLAQQQAIQQLLLQQQRSFPNEQKVNNQKPIHTQENLQKLTQQRKKKSHKQHLKQLQQQQQPLPLHQQSKQHNQLKQQILLKQQRSLLQQQQTKQLQEIQVQTKIQLKQQQVLMQHKQQAQQQVTQASFNQQSGSGPSFPRDLVKDNSTPTLVTDSNGNHFLVALTSHITDNQRTDAPGRKATNHIALQQLRPIPARLHDHIPFNQTKHSTHKGLLTQQEATNGGLPGSQPQRDVALCLSAPPSLRPFFEDQDAAPSSPSSPTELCPSLDDLFSPLSAASSETAASSPDDKDTEQEEDFIDIILQTGEMSTPFNPTPDPPHDRPNPPSSSSSPHHPSPFQLTLFPPIPSLCDAPQSASSLESDLQTLADTVSEKQHLSRAESGRLEDFLESTTGKPLSGAEPGGLLTLIDDLHSQMLCTPGILDHVLSPMDTFDLATVGEHGLDGMDWLDLTMGGEREEETSMLAPLGPQTPASVFSTDFLDGSDLPIHWDSCL